MKNKGFTLIELLAVIVILAIIALIATPLVLNTIEKAKEGAAKASAYAYAEEVERYIILSELDPTLPKLQPGVEYQLSSKKYEVAALADPSTTYINDLVSVKGELPESGYLILDREYKIEKMEMIIKSYSISCENDECNATESKTESKDKGPTIETPVPTATGVLKIIYLDPTDLTKTCTKENSVSTTATTSGCMKWYAYAETSSTYTMILDHNTTPLVAWNSDSTSLEIKEAKLALEKDIKNWDAKVKSTARFITADEVAEITEAKESLKWNESKYIKFPEYTEENLTFDINNDTHISWYYFDGQGNSYSKSANGWQLATATTPGSSKYAWLYDNLSNCTVSGCNVEDNTKYPIYNGTDYTEQTYNMTAYWTSTPLINDPNAEEKVNCIWVVEQRGSLSSGRVQLASYVGIRPVITINKDIIM